MVRRRPLAVIGALSAVIALQAAPAATAQVVAPGPRVIVTELPALSELPPLPSTGETTEVEEQEPGDVFGRSAVQTVALILAVGVLVAGGTGLMLVMRRGRGEPPEELPGRTKTLTRRAR